ncbi:PREDICTED: mammaglobin-A-like, partial [Galeopterus variegatus]|uniref:Mammaglobin-A-like n=1 Tax=Galeopterus variegatus TaxID=482537 RepID=A0ABM0SCA1_GALVR
MKLLVVLTLAALPLYCSAGSGCQLLEDIIANIIDPRVSTSQFKDSFQEFISNNETADAVDEFKQCFLKQSDNTLNSAEELV